MKELFRKAVSFWRKPSSNEHKELILRDEDILAKFVFRERDLKANGKITPSVLKPKHGEMLSFSEVTGLERPEICSYGHTYVDNPERGRIHIGYAKFKHESFQRLELLTKYDNDPERHVSVGFPSEPEKRREVSKALSNEALEISPQSEKKFFSGCE